MTHLIKFELKNGKHSEFGNSIVIRCDEIASIVQGKYEEKGWDRQVTSHAILFLKGNPNPFYLSVSYEEALTNWIKSVGAITPHSYKESALGLP